MGSQLRVGVFGPSGAVGGEILSLLEDPDWGISELLLFGSQRSAGSTVPWRENDVSITAFDSAVNYELDIAFLAVSSAVSKEIAGILTNLGTYVIDNSSSFRMDPNVPLVVPEINFSAIGPNTRLVANPNCCTIIMLMAVAPLRQFGRIRRIIVSTYQSASGAGREAMEELEESTRAALNGESFAPTILPHPYAFNLFSHNTEIGESGYNGEEEKVILETQKILEDPDLLVNPTCIRVPVLRSHSESITVEFEELAPSPEDVRSALEAFPGVRVVDDSERNYFPMPIDANGGREVLVGRIRRDVSNSKAISLFACGDQLLKGAALNAVQIGERIFGIR